MVVYAINTSTKSEKVCDKYMCSFDTVAGQLQLFRYLNFSYKDYIQNKVTQS